MKSTTSALDEPNKVKLTVTLEDSELETALEKAFKKIAGQVNIPGFRRGKAPRALLEVQIGTEAARAQALNDSLPDYCMDAIRQSELDAISAGKIEITEGEDEGTVVFTSDIELRPVPEIPGYKTLEVTIPAIDVTDDDVDEQITRLRTNHATLTEVDRPCKKGDFVTLDIEAERDGDPVPGLNATGYSYEVGASLQSFGEGFDAKIDGLAVGDEVEFTTSVPPNDDDVEFEVVVTAVEERILPELDDAWVSEVTEFATVEELRSDYRKRMEDYRRDAASHAVQDNALAALGELVTEDLPETLVNQEMQRQISTIDQRLRPQGFDIGKLLAMSGQSEEEFLDTIRTESSKSVRIDLALRSLAHKEGIEATEEEIEREIESLAAQLRQKPDRVRRDLERVDQMPAVRSDICNKKALRWLVEHVVVVDENGNSVDREKLDLDHTHNGSENA